VGGALAGGKIPEGAEVILSCQADANPHELSYRWFINDELMTGDFTTKMVSFFDNVLVNYPYNNYYPLPDYSQCNAAIPRSHCQMRGGQCSGQKRGKRDFGHKL